jgi:hypothetical protein
MANEHNLISLGDRTTSEQREIAKMGGIASGVARRERKRASEVARAILDSTITLDDGTEATTLFAMLRQQVNLALYGDTKAFLSLLKVADELPRGKQSQNDSRATPSFIVTDRETMDVMKQLDECGNSIYAEIINGELCFSTSKGEL